MDNSESFKPERVLITGGSGLLGMNWACAMRDKCDVVLGLHKFHVSLSDVSTIYLKLSDRANCIEKLRDVAPDIMVHAAGWTNVDECERNPSKAQRINAEHAEAVALMAEEVGSQLIHISTDQLFNGKKEKYLESDVPEPLNAYARAKCLAEQLVQRAYPNALIVRTNFFGWGHSRRRSMSDWVIEDLRSGRSPRMFDDVYFTPILVDQLVSICHELLECGVHGIIHVSGDETVSKYDFSRRLGMQFHLPADRIKRRQWATDPLKVIRPLNMSLANEKASRLLGSKLGGLNDFVETLRDQESEGRHAELLEATSFASDASDSISVAIPYGRHHLDEDDVRAVVEVLESPFITQGPKVRKFGEHLADYTGARFGWPVSSGTAALHLSVAALDIGPGDEVITTPMTFCATANAVIYQGAEVRFVDIDAQTLNLDPNQIEGAITDRTKAIMPVDYRGHPSALPEIRDLADRNGLRVIEDAAHAIGSTYKSNGITHYCGDGVHSDLCTFSFHPVKHITTGEGGAVMTNSHDLYQRIVQLGKHGIDRRQEMFDVDAREGEWVYDMECLGFNYRMTDFQAAMGINQLKKLDQRKSRRRKIAEFYNRSFNVFPELGVPFEADGVHSNFHIYSLKILPNKRFDRYDLFEWMRACKYHPMVHYKPVHMLKYFKNKYRYLPKDFPVALDCYQRSLSIPLYPSLTDSEVEKVVADITAFIKKKR